jgi:hypothetical protein
MSALSDGQRRKLLLSLHREDELNPIPPQDTDSRSELIHNHLPRLERAGLITWNKTTGVVEKGPHFDEVAAVLTLFEANRHGLPDSFLAEE